VALQHDHFFILTEPGAPAADLLSEIGLIEGSANRHPGQGTANRRFFLANSTLELLFIDDADEADHGRAAGLGFNQRLQDSNASPFGLVFRHQQNSTSPPFPGWRYCPEYFADDQCFHVGDNSSQLAEPLCICMPDNLPMSAKPVATENQTWRLTELRLDIPVTRPSTTLLLAADCTPLRLRCNRPHHLELVFNSASKDQHLDLRPDLPLSVSW
jgi:hypothetical protein